MNRRNFLINSSLAGLGAIILPKVKSQKPILDVWLKLLPEFPQRIIHGDPKITNFLFDA